MNAETTKAMEEALQAAVSRMHSGPAGTDTQHASNPIGLLMTLFSKLMENGEGRDELVDKIDGLQKEDLAVLRAQVRVLRKQLAQTLKMQHEMLNELREIRTQQNAVGNAVLDLADQLARIQIVEGLEQEPEEYEDEVAPAVASPRRNTPVSERVKTRQKSARKK